MYKIKELSILAGISTRTLRYYDEIGLLPPSHIGNNGYRYYTDSDVDILQQILLYKSLSFGLEEIKDILGEDTNLLSHLLKHKVEIQKKRDQLNTLLTTIDQTIAYQKGVVKMKNEDKFKGLIEQEIESNESKYGNEIRDKYGDSVVDASYAKMRKMSKWQHKRAEELKQLINQQLQTAMKTKDPKSLESIELAKMHQEWIQLYWDTYTTEAHLGLAQMYLEDERFKAYYDKLGVGSTEFLVKVLHYYLKKDH